LSFLTPRGFPPLFFFVFCYELPFLSLCPPPPLLLPFPRGSGSGRAPPILPVFFVYFFRVFFPFFWTLPPLVTGPPSRGLFVLLGGFLLPFRRSAMFRHAFPSAPLFLWTLVVVETYTWRFFYLETTLSWTLSFLCARKTFPLRVNGSPSPSSFFSGKTCPLSPFVLFLLSPFFPTATFS